MTSKCIYGIEFHFIDIPTKLSRQGTASPANDGKSTAIAVCSSSNESRIRDSTYHTICYADICVLRMSSCSGDADVGVMLRSFVAMCTNYVT